jgi:hypothetical protein
MAIEMPANESMGFINNVSSSYLQSVFSNVSQNSGLTNNTTSNDPSAISTALVAPQTDNQQLSPFAQLLSTLQQLQQTDPAKYQQVTQQIAANLESAAQTAQADGNSTAATHLNQLATDFTTASTSGQLPNIQDLGQAMSGHHHHSHSGSADPDGGSSASGNAQTLNQLLSTFQADGSQGSSQDPLAIILNTLSGAGISGSNS